MAGVPGAVLATVGIFLPGFVFVAITNPFIPRMRRSPWLSALLDGVVAASLGLMAAVTVELARQSIVDVPTALLLLAAAVLLIRFRVNSTWLILGGAAVGLLLSAAVSYTHLGTKRKTPSLSWRMMKLTDASHRLQTPSKMTRSPGWLGLDSSRAFIE